MKYLKWINTALLAVILICLLNLMSIGKDIANDLETVNEQDEVIVNTLFRISQLIEGTAE